MRRASRSIEEDDGPRDCCIALLIKRLPRSHGG
jgi:hypothetical protein